MRKKTFKILGHNLVIAILAIIWIIPIVWLLCTSFSAYDGINTSSFLPAQWSASHYASLFQTDTVNQFPRWFMNTFKIACFTCVISTMFVLMVAYATSYFTMKRVMSCILILLLLGLVLNFLLDRVEHLLLKWRPTTSLNVGADRENL